jgi:hypothetical protein
MAITDFFPSILTGVREKQRPQHFQDKSVALGNGLAKSAHPFLQLVRDSSVDKPKAVSTGSFISFTAIVVAIFVVGLLSLLGINMALTSGAFEMEHLKLHLIAMNDQKEALLNQESSYSSPDRLAIHAKALGMQPQTTINFLSLGTEKKR